MKRLITLIALAVVAAAQCSSWAQDKADAIKAAAAMQAQLMQKLMAKFDLNGDGNIDDAEKGKAMDQMKKDIADGNLPDGLKDLLDRNGDGKLEPQELAAMREIVGRMQAAAAQGGGNGQPGFPGFGGQGGAGGAGGAGGFGFGDSFPPDVVKKFDKNKDGKLDETEKKAAMAAFGPKKSRKEQLMDKLDLNGDGKVTKEEKEQVAAQRKAEQEEKKAEAEAKKAEADAKKGKSKKEEPKKEESEKDN